MNPPNDEQLEQLLRAAPTPPPPAGLSAALERDLPRGPRVAALRARTTAGWLGQWWPVLAAACVTLGCFVVAGLQSVQIAELRRTVEEARSHPAVSATPPGPAAIPRDPQVEMAELKARMAALEAEIAVMESPGASADAPAAAATAEDEAAFREAAQKLAEARDRAQSIRCVNHLKQLGLAARVWATDNGDVLPSAWLQMTNEMVTPKILVCPADTTRTAAADWSGFGPANVSYEFVSQSVAVNEPQVVQFRCPIHGHVCLADGSVQMDVARTHPEWLRMINGRLHLTGGQAHVPRPAGVTPAPGSMSPELARRYGLVPASPGQAAVVHSYNEIPAPPVMSEELMQRDGLLPRSNVTFILGDGEVPGQGAFDVTLEASTTEPDGQPQPPEEP